jgi:hypothetical protein
MTSMVLLMHGKNNGIAVYVPKETIVKEMATKIKISQHFFLDLIRELSDICRQMMYCLVKEIPI